MKKLHLDIQCKLKQNGLKVTPQRIAVFEAVIFLNNHPTAEKINEYIKKTHPGIAIGTIYKVLETLVEKGLIEKVKTDSDFVRYDAKLENHHHLYCTDTKKIIDYSDPNLDKLLQDYFAKKQIQGFEIENIKLNINGKYINN